MAKISNVKYSKIKYIRFLFVVQTLLGLSKGTAFARILRNQISRQMPQNAQMERSMREVKETKRILLAVALLGIIGVLSMGISHADEAQEPNQNGRFTYGLDRDLSEDELAQMGSQYDDRNLPPPSQNPALNGNTPTAQGNGGSNGGNGNNGDVTQANNGTNGAQPQQSNLLPHEYPSADRLTSPDIPTAQLKAGIEFAKSGDYQNAYDSFKKSCKGGNPSGCFAIGTMYATGKGVDTNIRRAKKYYEIGCSAGDPTSCTNLAMLYNDDKTATKDDKELAAQYYMSACEGGDAIACNNLGFMYANGDGMAKDFFTAIKYYKLACEGGSNLGCYNLGLLSNTKNIYGKKKSELSQADLNYAACNAGDIVGCSNLGWMYANGVDDVPLSYAYAAKYFKRACEARDVKSCSNLGVLYQKGLGVTQDTKYALDLYTYSCNAGLQQACDNYRILKEDLHINPKPTYNIKPRPSKQRQSSAYKR